MSSLRFAGTIIAIVCCTAAHAQTTSYSGFVLGLRNPPLNKVAEAIDAKRWTDAHRTYEQNLSAMSDLSGSDLDIIRALAAHAIGESSPALMRCTETLDTLSKEDDAFANAAKWPTLRAALVDANGSLEATSRFAVVKRTDVSFAARESCDTARSRVIAKAITVAPVAFAYHFEGNVTEFESSYPVPLEMSLFGANLANEAAKSAPEKATIARFNRLTPVVAKHAPIEQKRLFANQFARVKLSGDPELNVADFERKLLEHFSLFGLAASDLTDLEDVGVEVRGISANENTTLPRLSFKTMVPSVSSMEALTPKGRWTLVVSPVTWSTSREVRDKAQPKSRFLFETRRIPNPAYAAAQIRFNDADFQLKRAQIDVSRLTGWAAVGGAFIVAGHASNRESAYRALMSTPETLEEPVYRDYEYSTNKVVVRRKLEAELLAIDSLRGEVSRSPIVIEDNSEFALAYGIHEKDKDVVRSIFAPESDVEAYERTAIKVDIARALASWTAGTKSSMTGGVAGLRVAAFQARQTPAQQAALAVSAAQQSDTRFESVVVIRTPKGAGTGFFVAPNLVLTNQHVVEGSQFAEVKLRDGKETFGKVVRSDVNADLALIETAQSGKPVEFALQPLKSGETVDLIGHPRGMDYTLTRGIVSAIRAISNPAVRGGNQVLMIQTDAAINPGNSGGPMFAGSKVVGVNTQRLKDGAGLGFAVHFSEVIRFMSASN